MIVTLLGNRELSAGDIAKALSRPRPGVSHHLSVLLENGIVTCRHERGFRYYRLEPRRALAAWDEYLGDRVGSASLRAV